MNLLFNVSFLFFCFLSGSVILASQSVNSPSASSQTTSSTPSSTAASPSSTISTALKSTPTATTTTKLSTTATSTGGSSKNALFSSSLNSNLMIKSTGYIVLIAMIVSLLLCLCCCLIMLLRQRGGGGGGGGKRKDLDWDYKSSNGGSGGGITSLPAASFSNEPGLFAPGIPPITPGSGFKVRKVAAGYAPALGDELELKVGDKITVLVEYDDGWCQGINHSRSGAKGVFPKHCLEPLTTTT